MNHQLSYYATGQKFFGTGEDIYINRATEQIEPHLHAHDFIEIAYVLSGHGIHRIGESEYSVSRGDLFIINCNVPHEFRSLPHRENARLSVYNCIFTPRFLDASLVNCKDFSDLTSHFLFRSLFPEEGENRADISLLGSDSTGIEELYEKMYREYQMKEQGYVEILRAYVIELLITVFRLWRKGRGTTDGVEMHRRQIIEKTIHFLKSNYAQEVKLEEISLLSFLSRNYFCKLFKENTGMTVLEYTQKIRIQEACRLLKDTDKKVIDIAFEVGYKDLKFFNQIFKRNTGKTPVEYRKSN